MGAVGGVSIRAYAIAKRDCWGRDEREGYFEFNREKEFEGMNKDNKT